MNCISSFQWDPSEVQSYLKCAKQIELFQLLFHSRLEKNVFLLWHMTEVINKNYSVIAGFLQDTKFCESCRAFVSQIVTGYLPSLILMLFLKIVPPIMEFLSSIQGYISHSEIERSACNKVLWFTVWNIFFATVFSGSVLNQISIVLDPKNIPAKLAVVVPAQVNIC